jgi:hypothetical protein
MLAEMVERKILSTTEETEDERRSKYTTLCIPMWDEIYQWIIEFNTDASIARKIGVHPKTFSRWIGEYVDFADMITRARRERSQLMKHKVYQAACGMTVDLIEEKVLKDGQKVTLKKQQYFPPNVNAADFVSRQPDGDPDYVGPKSVEITNNTTNNFQLDDWEAKRQQILSEIRKLELAGAVDVETIPVEDK